MGSSTTLLVASLLFSRGEAFQGAPVVQQHHRQQRGVLPSLDASIAFWEDDCDNSLAARLRRSRASAVRPVPSSDVLFQQPTPPKTIPPDHLLRDIKWYDDLPRVASSFRFQGPFGVPRRKQLPPPTSVPIRKVSFAPLSDSLQSTVTALLQKQSRSFSEQPNKLLVLQAQANDDAEGPIGGGGGGGHSEPPKNDDKEDEPSAKKSASNDKTPPSEGPTNDSEPSSDKDDTDEQVPDVGRTVAKASPDTAAPAMFFSTTDVDAKLPQVEDSQPAEVEAAPTPTPVPTEPPETPGRLVTEKAKVDLIPSIPADKLSSAASDLWNNLQDGVQKVAQTAQSFFGDKVDLDNLQQKLAVQAGVNATTVSSVGVSTAVLSALFLSQASNGQRDLESAVFLGALASYLTVTDNPIGDVLRLYGSSVYQTFLNLTGSLEEQGGAWLSFPNEAGDSLAPEGSQPADAMSIEALLSPAVTGSLVLVGLGAPPQAALAGGVLLAYAATTDGPAGDASRLLGGVGMGVFVFGKDLVAQASLPEEERIASRSPLYDPPRLPADALPKLPTTDKENPSSTTEEAEEKEASAMVDEKNSDKAAPVVAAAAATAASRPGFFFANTTATQSAFPVAAPETPTQEESAVEESELPAQEEATIAEPETPDQEESVVEKPEGEEGGLQVEADKTEVDPTGDMEAFAAEEANLPGWSASVRDAVAQLIAVSKQEESYPTYATGGPAMEAGERAEVIREAVARLVVAAKEQETPAFQADVEAETTGEDETRLGNVERALLWSEAVREAVAQVVVASDSQPAMPGPGWSATLRAAVGELLSVSGAETNLLVGASGSVDSEPLDDGVETTPSALYSMTEAETRLSSKLEAVLTSVDDELEEVATETSVNSFVAETEEELLEESAAADVTEDSGAVKMIVAVDEAVAEELLDDSQAASSRPHTKSGGPTRSTTALHEITDARVRLLALDTRNTSSPADMGDSVGWSEAVRAVAAQLTETDATLHQEQEEAATGPPRKDSMLVKFDLSQAKALLLTKSEAEDSTATEAVAEDSSIAEQDDIPQTAATAESKKVAEAVSEVKAASEIPALSRLESRVSWLAAEIESMGGQGEAVVEPESAQDRLAQRLGVLAIEASQFGELVEPTAAEPEEVTGQVESARPASDMSALSRLGSRVGELETEIESFDGSDQLLGDPERAQDRLQGRLDVLNEASESGDEVPAGSVDAVLEDARTEEESKPEFVEDDREVLKEVRAASDTGALSRLASRIGKLANEIELMDITGQLPVGAPSAQDRLQRRLEVLALEASQFGELVGEPGSVGLDEDVASPDDVGEPLVSNTFQSAASDARFLLEQRQAVPQTLEAALPSEDDPTASIAAEEARVSKTSQAAVSDARFLLEQRQPVQSGPQLDADTVAGVEEKMVVTEEIPAVAREEEELEKSVAASALSDSVTIYTTTDDVVTVDVARISKTSKAAATDARFLLGQRQAFAISKPSKEEATEEDQTAPSETPDTAYQTFESDSTSSNEEPTAEEEVTLYVGNLDYATDKAVLTQVFEEFGKVQNVALPRRRGTSQIRGYAFVTLASRASAEAAIRELDQVEFDGRPVSVSEARRPSEKEPPTEKEVATAGEATAGSTPSDDTAVGLTRLFVGNLSNETSMDQIKELFAEYGTVRNCFRPASGESRGFCFVDMPSADAENAVRQLNGQTFQGNLLRVNEARPPPLEF